MLPQAPIPGGEPVWADLLLRLRAAGLFPDDRALIDRIRSVRR
jgi:hypothetical protein